MFWVPVARKIKQRRNGGGNGEDEEERKTGPIRSGIRYGVGEVKNQVYGTDSHKQSAEQERLAQSGRQLFSAALDGKSA